MYVVVLFLLKCACCNDKAAAHSKYSDAYVLLLKGATSCLYV
jgi:hypothetical protein